MIPTGTITTHTPEETREAGISFARSWLRYVGEPSARPLTVCLYGELGSGKTTFMGGVAAGLGITSRILSPTFVLVRQYAVPGTDYRLVHADLYRLDSPEGIAGSGITEMMADPSCLVCIEWADRLAGLLPASRIDIRCSVHATDGSHTIEIAYG